MSKKYGEGLDGTTAPAPGLILDDRGEVGVFQGDDRFDGFEDVDSVTIVTVFVKFSQNTV